MISIEKARSGHSVLRKNGRLLGSSFDPVKEAATWALKAKAAIEPEMSVFVLGAGSGYHVAALAGELRNNAIIVIDCDVEVTAEARKFVEIPHNVALVAEPEWMKLGEHGPFADGLGGRYAILKHGPSCLIDQVYFANVEALLLARDQTSFLLQLKTRPDLAALLDPELIKKIGAAPVSIKTLQGLFGAQATCTRERRIWKILEELVV